MDLAMQIATRREINEVAERWIIGAFRSWIDDGADARRLPLFLRLETGTRATVARRNYWLRLAAGELPTDQRAAAMAKEIKAFLRKCWPAWRAFDTPPDDASPLYAALFYAADTGATIDITRRQLCNILAGK